MIMANIKDLGLFSQNKKYKLKKIIKRLFNFNLETYLGEKQEEISV